MKLTALIAVALIAGCSTTPKTVNTEIVTVQPTGTPTSAKCLADGKTLELCWREDAAFCKAFFTSPDAPVCTTNACAKGELDACMVNRNGWINL